MTYKYILSLATFLSKFSAICSLSWKKTSIIIIKKIKKMSGEIMQSSYSENYDTESCDIITQKKSAVQQQKGNWSEGLWNVEEKMRFVAFILFNKEALSSKLQRRVNKIFKQMSSFIGSRNPSQCRSQNQKMYKRFNTINRIVTQFKKEIGQTTFEKCYSELCEEPTIKFSIEGEIKVPCTKQQSVLIIKQTNDVEIQTESIGTFVSMDEMWLYNMFKLERMNSIANLCLHQSSNPYFGFSYNYTRI